MRQVNGLLAVSDRKRNVLASVAMVVLAFVLCGSSRPALAQVVTADVVGTVSDPTGGLLPNVRITVVNVETELKRTTETGSDGHFEVTLLPVGRYRVTAELAGFKVTTIREIALAQGDRQKLDLRMELGQRQEMVEIQAQTPALQSETSSLGTLFDQHSVEDLPLNGRNFMQLAQLSAGANAGAANALASGNRPDDRRSSSNVTVNGQMSYANNFLIDGLDDNERYIGTLIIKPSVDAVSEFKVITNGYAAELGRTAGGVIVMLTKSGTDNFHGS